MNRSTMYEYLKGIEEMKPLFHRYGKGYYVEFVPHIWVDYSQIVVNGSLFIEDFYSIEVLATEIVVICERSKMKIHIEYKDIKTFDVVVCEMMGCEK